MHVLTFLIPASRRRRHAVVLHFCLVLLNGRLLIIYLLKLMQNKILKTDICVVCLLSLTYYTLKPVQTFYSGGNFVCWSAVIGHCITERCADWSIASDIFWNPRGTWRNETNCMMCTISKCTCTMMRYTSWQAQSLGKNLHIVQLTALDLRIK